MVWPPGHDRFIEYPRLGRPARKAQQLGQQLLHGQIVRRIPNQIAEMLLGLAELPLVAQNEREMEAPGGVVRSDGESGAIGRGGLVQPLQITQRAAEIEEGADMIGPQLGGAAVGSDGARRLSQILQCDAQVVAGLGIVGRQAKR
jgi:hypothetical protein